MENIDVVPKESKRERISKSMIRNPSKPRVQLIKVVKEQVVVNDKLDFS